MSGNALPRWWFLTDKALEALGRPTTVKVPVLDLPWREDVPSSA